MTMKYQALTSALLLTLATAGSAYAQVLFEELDTDHNGAISKQEAKARMDLKENFNMIDKNGNGSISVDEYTAYENRGQMVPEEVEVPEPGAAPVMR
jgi:Ca2+-binding EF-hand superfamily protein